MNGGAAPIEWQEIGQWHSQGQKMCREPLPQGISWRWSHATHWGDEAVRVEAFGELIRASTGVAVDKRTAGPRRALEHHRNWFGEGAVGGGEGKKAQVFEITQSLLNHQDDIALVGGR